MYRMYKSPSSAESKDRIWLCRLLVVFALGQSYSSNIAPSISLVTEEDEYGGPTDQRVTSPSGIEFFEQALLLLKLNYEEPVVEHVEVLNLIVSNPALYELLPLLMAYALNRLSIAIL